MAFYQNLIALFIPRFFDKRRITLKKVFPEKATEAPVILMFSTSDGYGGAARSAYRILSSLSKKLFTPILAVKNQSTFQKNIVAVPLKPVLYTVVQLLKLIVFELFFLKRFKTGNTIYHSPAYASKLDSAAVINRINPEIVHLHWLGHNLMTIEEIGKITKPIVWTFHDMWPFCAAEHVAYDERFVEGYVKGNRPATESGFDLNRWVWERKRVAWRKIAPLYVVCPSQWMADCAARSILFRNSDITVIPNGLDTDGFKPDDRKSARKTLNLPEDKFILLFGAMDAVSDNNKGYDLLVKSLNILAGHPIKKKLCLVVFGNRAALPEVLAGIPLHGLGMIDSDAKLAKAYSAADATVVPSRIESFGQTASESLACGTPVVCFDTSGLKSVVDHLKNGYRAQCYSPEDLAKGIEWIFADTRRYAALRKKARLKAEKEFSLQKLAENYGALYERVLRETSGLSAHHFNKGLPRSLKS